MVKLIHGMSFLLFLLFVPMPEGQHQVQILTVRQVSNIRHTVGAIVAELLQFFLVLVWAYDHDVRPHMKVFARTVPALVRHPSTDIHISDSHSGNMWVAASQTVLHPMQKDRIKTARLVM